MSCPFSGFHLSYSNDLGFFAIDVVVCIENRQGWYIFFSQMLNLLNVLNLFDHEFGMPVP